MSIKLIKKSRELEKTRCMLLKFEDLNKRMSQELLNMADSAVLHDIDGIAIFYKKLLDLHHQFMAIEVE